MKDFQNGKISSGKKKQWQTFDSDYDPLNCETSTCHDAQRDDQDSFWISELLLWFFLQPKLKVSIFSIFKRKNRGGN